MMVGYDTTRVRSIVVRGIMSTRSKSHLRDRLFCCDWSSYKKSRVNCCGEVPYNNPRFECIHRCIKVLIVAMS